MRRLFEKTDKGVVLRVQVQPGAGREAVVGTHGDALKIRVVAPPVSGRANEAVLALVERELGAAKGTVTLTAGKTSRQKRVAIEGVDPEEFDRRLRLLLERVESGRGRKR